MIAFNSLKKIGFKISNKIEDQGFIYKTADISINNSYVSVCNEYSADGHCINQTLTINDRELKGKEPTIDFLLELKQIL